MVNINYEIPTELHKEIRIKAAEEGITLKDWIIKTLSSKSKS